MILTSVQKILNRLTVTSPGFRRNLFTLASGTTISQALGLAFIPLLTRLYEPQAFGLFGIFYALICVLGIVTTWRLDVAVMLPKEDSEARTLWKGIFILLSANSAILTAILFVILQYMSLGSRPWVETWITLCLGLFLIAFAEVLMQWHARRQNYRVLAIKNVIERLSVTLFAVVFAYMGLELAGLIWAQIAAMVLYVAYMLAWTYPNSPLHEKVLVSQVKGVLKSYKDFPLMQGWSMLFLIGSSQLPNLLFGSSFSMTDTGHVNLAYRILEAPVNLFYAAFAATFYQHISQLSAIEINRLFRKSVRSLIQWVFPPVVLCAVLAPFLFPVLFGDHWASTGRMATPLAFMAFAKILYLSHSVIFLVLRRLDLDLKISIALVAAQLLGFYITRAFSNDAAKIVTMMAALSTLVFGLGTLLIAQETKRLSHQTFE